MSYLSSILEEEKKISMCLTLRAIKDARKSKYVPFFRVGEIRLRKNKQRSLYYPNRLVSNLFYFYLNKGYN